MRREIVPRLLILLILLMAFCYAMLYHVAPYAIIKPHRPTIEETLEYFDAIHPRDYDLQYHDFAVTVEDSISLVGWLIESNTDSALGTVILMHGIASCKEHMLGAAKLLADSQFNVILYDSRAHGQSGGTYCTYGFYERNDLSAILDHVSREFGQVGPFAVWANSFGGAVALQAMAQEKRIVCGVIESTFARLDEIARDYMARLTGIRCDWLANTILREAEKIADFSVAAVKPEESAKSIAQPVLLIHGDKDEQISVKYGKRIFKNLQAQDKELYVMPDGDHYNLWQAGGTDYVKKVITFLTEHSGSSGS